MKIGKIRHSCSLSSVVVRAVDVLPLRPPSPSVGICGPMFSRISEYCSLDYPGVKDAAGAGTDAGVFGVR